MEEGHRKNAVEVEEKEAEAFAAQAQENEGSLQVDIPNFR